MTDSAQPILLIPDSRADQIFPTLSPAQVARVGGRRGIDCSCSGASGAARMKVQLERAVLQELASLLSPPHPSN